MQGQTDDANPITRVDPAQVPRNDRIEGKPARDDSVDTSNLNYSSNHGHSCGPNDFNTSVKSKLVYNRGGIEFNAKDGSTRDIGNNSSSSVSDSASCSTARPRPTTAATWTATMTRSSSQPPMPMLFSPSTSPKPPAASSTSRHSCHRHHRQQ